MNYRFLGICKRYVLKYVLIFQGAYVPLTMQGKIVVDGLLVSCYADVGRDVAHLTMTPMHWFPEIIEKVFGMDMGFSTFVYIARELGTLLMPPGQLFS